MSNSSFGLYTKVLVEQSKVDTQLHTSGARRQTQHTKSASIPGFGVAKNKKTSKTRKGGSQQQVRMGSPPTADKILMGPIDSQ
jgi:hypothetical protein